MQTNRLSLIRRQLNRLLFEQNEIKYFDGNLFGVLQTKDSRHKHIIEVTLYYAAFRIVISLY
jgi:hypothetical protein